MANDKQLLESYGSSINAAVAVKFDEKFGDVDVPRAFHPGFQEIRESVLKIARESWNNGDNDIMFQQKIIS